MGIVLTYYGQAFALHTNSFFCIFKGIAVDRAGRLTVGAGCGRICLTFGIVREMVSDGARCNSACAPLANTGRGVFDRVAVHTLLATMIICIDALIIEQTLIVVARIDDAFSFLA